MTKTGMTSLQLRPPAKQKLSDILYGQILQQIVSGAFAEGDKLPTEQEICNGFGVSRPVVREALLRLQADGLIQSRRGAGSFVRRSPPTALTSFAEASEVAMFLRSFELRLALEPEAARLAASRRTLVQLQFMQESIDQLEEAFVRSIDARDEDFAFHRAVAEATGNDLFVSTLDSLKPSIGVSMHVALGLSRLGSKERKQVVVGEHRRIVSAIDAGDGDLAAHYMRHHLIEARQRITDSHRDS